MSVPRYLDHHVKAAITQGLRNRGVDVITCAEDGTELIGKVLEPAEMKNRIEFLPYS